MDIPQSIVNDVNEQAAIVLSDPNATEEEKNEKCMVAAVVDLMNFKFPDDERIKWETLQLPIYEQLKFEGCQIEKYDPKYDGLAGCYMKWKHNDYEVCMDVEDIKSMSEFRYVVITIKRYDEDEEAMEEDDGTVKTIEEAKAICDLIKNDKLDEARRILHLYDPVTRTNKTEAELEAILCKPIPRWY